MAKTNNSTKKVQEYPLTEHNGLFNIMYVSYVL